ncbi:MAG: glycosyltransferase family A protein [Pseudomonadota bacterium]
MPPDITISHLIPLYRSRRFAPVIAANVAELAAPDAEIILADRNGDRAFCDELRAQLADVPNLRLLCDDSDANWVDNIQGLIDAARGAYLQILPHDDTTTKAATRAMVAALNAAPDAVLAYGRVRAFDLSGAPLPERDELNARETSEATSWTLEDALPLLWVGRFNGAFKGVIRRATAHHPACRFVATPSTALSERAWLFALALQGRFQFVAMDVLHKRYYPDSTHRGWTVTAQTFQEAAELMKTSIDTAFADAQVRAYALRDITENCAARMASLEADPAQPFRYRPAADLAADPAQTSLRATPIAWGANH